MVDTYQQTTEEVVRTYRRVHGNGEQTRVVIMSAGERDYVAVAFDIDPADFSPMAADVIGYDPTIEGVQERAERWMQQHPKGVLQAVGGDGDSGGGFKGKVLAAAGKLNDYGNDLRKQQQQVEHGKQIAHEDNNE